MSRWLALATEPEFETQPPPDSMTKPDKSPAIQPEGGFCQVLSNCQVDPEGKVGGTETPKACVYVPRTRARDYALNKGNQVMATRGRKAFTSNQELAIEIDRYFLSKAPEQRSEKVGGIPTLSGLANFLGVDRRTLHRWANGDNQERAEQIQHAKSRIEAELEQLLYNRRTYRAAVFSLGCNFGWEIGI